MSKKHSYFDLGNKIFWALILLVLVFTILKLNPGIFKTDYVVREIIVEDSLSKIDWKDKIIEDDSVRQIADTDSSDWNWVDFKGIKHNITFSFPKNALEKAKQNRLNSHEYEPLYQNDKVLLENLITQMRSEIKGNNLDYLKAIEYVCSSIQYIPYTLVLPSSGIEYPPKSRIYVKCPCELPFGVFSNNCDSKKPGGCCNDVDPFGVYSPFEFAFKKTGDCDTRSLLAYTILKEMGFDVAVMVSKKEAHSVLGIYLPNSNQYSTGKSVFGKKYVLWELTSPAWRLSFPVAGDDWIAALE